jgi:N-acetylglucosaminyldiphosphoundecaprenol N-acetyl-beta-D-mannosaminyltransferase
MESVHVLGVEINSISVSELIRYISSSKEPTWIVTTNPEILLYAKEHENYCETLNRSTFRTIDSFGLQLACKRKGIRAQRIPGADLAYELVRSSATKHESIALIGGGDMKSAQPALKRLQHDFEGLAGIAEDGGIVTKDGIGDEENREARLRIAESNPSVLLVGFGHPKQEQWIERYRHEFPSVRVFIGVGGTFDYWSGMIPRAPTWMRSLGIEWLYRFTREPSRWKRILRAVFVFPYYAMKE